MTDRCNLRCVYCMPAEGVPLARHEDILSFEEIAEVTRTAVEMGVDKVRITGGEPLVRRGITRLVEMLAGIGGIRDLAMTTNGVLLAEFAAGLKQAGLGRTNVSLDTVDPQRYRRITRGGELTRALAGIDAAAAAGLTPVKLNCVVEESSCEPDAQEYTCPECDGATVMGAENAMMCEEFEIDDVPEFKNFQEVVEDFAGVKLGA